jgi:hypothetical protein
LFEGDGGVGELYLQLDYLPKTAVPDEVPFVFSLDKWDSVPPDGRGVYAEAPICLLEWLISGGQDDEALRKLSR